MNIKHPVIKLIVVVAVVAGALIFLFRDRFNCEANSRIQASLCGFVGGEFAAKTVMIGFSESYKYGCFPKDKTADAGTHCKSDIECQGYCLWLGGDIVTEGSSKTCSDFKKAIPICVPH
jgi:hypothetical protein